MYKRHFYLVFSILLVANFLLAQDPIAPILESLDSSKVTYNYADNPSSFYILKDTLLQNNFQQYNPTRKRDLDWVHLGNLGTAARPMIYQSTSHEFFDMGFHQFDLYLLKTENIKYHFLKRAYTEAYYSQGAQQNNGVFIGKFAANFKNGTSANLHYQRINHKGYFEFQRARHNSLSYGMRFASKNNKYESYFSYVNNNISQENNGRVNNNLNGEDLFLNPLYNNRLNIPVQLDESMTTQRYQEFSYQHFYRVQGKKDSLNTERRTYQINHQIAYNPQTYLFYDKSPSEDSLYYGDLHIDSRGIRQYVSVKTLKNKFQISTSKLRKSKTNEVKEQRDWFQVGITHANHQINHEPSDSTFNNLLLHGRWHFSPNDRMNLKTYASYGLWGDVGQFRMEGQFTLDFFMFGKLKLAAMNQRFAPSLVQQKMYLTQNEFWNNDFEKPIETELSAEYEVPVLGLRARAQYNLLNNHIYFGEDGMASQFTGALSIGQLMLQKDFTLWRFHLDNLISFQQASENIMRMPEVYSKHSAYFEGRVFRRAMLLRMGFDFRFNTPYFADTYNPYIGQFYLQNETEIDFFPASDFYLAFKVKTFRFFFKIENFTNYFLNDIQYETPNHPMMEKAFRFGISWKWMD